MRPSTPTVGPVVRIGTRASALARTQSTLVAEWLTQATGRPTELVMIRTEGDVNGAPLAQIGGTGVFVSALREALLRGEVDLAVHSLKDLPDRSRRRHRARRRPGSGGPPRRGGGPRRPHPR